MIKFKYREHFACEPKAAFEATTAEFAGLEKYIPNVTKIEVLAHENKDNGTVRWLLKFFGDGAIPLVARPVIKPDMLRWNEEMICDSKALTIDWTIMPYVFTKHFTCGGKTTYSKDAKGECEMTIDGYLNVSPMHIPGIPESIVRKALQAFEPFIVKFIPPNLGKFYTGIKKRMKDQGKLK